MYHSSSSVVLFPDPQFHVHWGSGNESTFSVSWPTTLLVAQKALQMYQTTKSPMFIFILLLILFQSGLTRPSLFFHLLTCTKHLQWNVIITQDCWIRNTVRTQHTLYIWFNSLNVLGVMNATALWPTLNLGIFMNYSEVWNWDYCHIMSGSQPRRPFRE